MDKLQTTFLAVFLFLLLVSLAPSFSLSLFNEVPVGAVGETEITNTDILHVFTLIAGAATIASFIVTVRGRSS